MNSHNSLDSGHWVFGYGSLIYKVDFPFKSREEAVLHGWSRRFWQGSHDHRGTPESPGRVVTLIPDSTAICRGVIYLVEEDVFQHLDHREKNGYRRHESSFFLPGRQQTVEGTVYVADESNPAFLGPDSDEAIAQHIARSHGPSGSNAEYLLKLAVALRDLGEDDPHVNALERELLALEVRA